MNTLLTSVNLFYYLNILCTTKNKCVLFTWLIFIKDFIVDVLFLREHWIEFIQVINIDGNDGGVCETWFSFINRYYCYCNDTDILLIERQKNNNNYEVKQ